MADLNHDRTINRMTWIAFILAAIAGLLSIVLGRPAPGQEHTAVDITRSL